MNVRLAAALAANKRLAVLQRRRPLSMCGLEELCFSAIPVGNQIPTYWKSDGVITSSGALPGASANDRQFLGRYDSHRYLYVLLPISIVVGLFFVRQGALPRRRRDFMPFDGRSL
jgi:hypothetical protein